MSVEEARALVTDEVTALDRATLLAERAEAEAQLRAAEATLGIPPAGSNGDAGTSPEASEQEPDEAAQKTQDVDAPNEAATLDVEELRAAAAAARTADDELAKAASEAERPRSGDARLQTAESAFEQVLEIQEDLPAAWRRLVGALISATGMAIVVGALGWNVYWLLVPIALIAILTVDLRLSGKAAREASAGAARELALVGVEGAEGLDRIRLERVSAEEAEGRLATARADRDAAYARFEALAPGRRPSEIEEIIAEYEADQADAAAKSEAEAPAEPQEIEVSVEPDEVEVSVEPDEVEVSVEPDEVELLPEPEEVPVEPEEVDGPAEVDISTAEPAAEVAPEPFAAATAQEPSVEVPATAGEWWFGSKEVPAPPAAASAPVRALAERLSAEGREALARIEAQLAALERVEHARKSLEWHEANGSAERSATEAPPEKS
jgi:hypothetical protein